MRIKLLILTFLFLFFGVSSVFAGEPPIQLSPSNNSTVTSSKLEWQIPPYSLYTGGSYYMVQVDDQQDFTNPEKNNIYLTNNYYTPKLNPGTWYWRVKAKDSSGVWSDWSSVWSFTLQSAPSSPSPTPTPAPTPIPTTSPTPSSTSSTSTSTSSFTISNVPSQTNSDQSFNVSVNLFLPNNPNTNFYLKGAFKKADSSNYFGLAKVSGSWIKNSNTYSSQFPITTNSSGNWSGNLEVQADSEDSGFTGTGDYIFKVGRYTSAGSGPTWSNEANIKIVSVESSNQETTAVLSASNDSPFTTNPSTAPSAKSKVITSSQSKSYDKLVYHTASVAAATASAIPLANAEVKSQKTINYFNWAGGLMIVSGTLVLAFVYLRNSNLREAIFNFFRKRN